MQQLPPEKEELQGRLESLEKTIGNLTAQLSQENVRSSPIASRTLGQPGRKERRSSVNGYLPLDNVSPINESHTPAQAQSSSFYRSARAQQEHRGPEAHVPSAEVRTKLIDNARLQKDIEPLALFMFAHSLPQAPIELYESLLDAHWTWIQPIYNFIYRPAFVRGLCNESNSPYFSPFLLYALLAHSARFCRNYPVMLGYEPLINQFWEKAKGLLVEELEKPSSVSTVQGLLLLSAIENSRGRTSQSWSYSGLAFRMVQDLSLQLDNQDSVNGVQLTDEDVEVRRRLWWSAYFWDKLLSVYFGRRPMLREVPNSPPTVLADDSTEHDPWIPLSRNLTNYIPQPGYAVSCFAAACRTATLLDQLLERYYGNGAASQGVQAEDEDLMAQAVSLLSDLPPQLQISNNLPGHHHIVVLNCLINSVIILTHRPHCLSTFHPTPDTIAQRCLDSADTVLQFARTHFSAYGDCNFVSIAWSIFTASTIYALHVAGMPPSQRSCPSAQKFIETETMLSRIAESCAVVQLAAKAVGDQVHKLGIQDPTSALIIDTNNPSSISNALSVDADPFHNLGEHDPFSIEPDSFANMCNSFFFAQNSWDPAYINQDP
ncbi:uncharacterized protein I303_104115 [Kwoniella dejecticola CBS 10117]|uniref:Xylanolytic transcriptional activator regulatory domain-containing protein n=1 Tax=Kwoniella dejecticola CBS 10117 TaxID=1296121 RepID=A0A1A6A694_9TREE|nr:uncharacterized protein I303_04906 [Kwoniella dejecticola CBS 10117]OBR85570.1 hypothetical protein I303_04906 [Kwoniella dejecticola CBS 10117]